MGVVVATAALLLMGPVFEKFTATWLAMATGSRLTWWAGALRVIGDHPWFGVGPRNFILIDRGTASSAVIEITAERTAHAKRVA